MAVGAAGGDVQHVAGAGLDRVVVEAVLDPAREDEDRVPGFAPVRLTGWGRVGRAFLIAQGDAEAGMGFPDLQAFVRSDQR